MDFCFGMLNMTPLMTDSRDLELLVPEFKAKVVQTLLNCSFQHVTMIPFITLRTPQRQGQLWCQSRTEEQISQAAYVLIRSGAPYLAKCIDVSMATRGKWATNALPGDSWHQYGEAVDCFVSEDGKAVWDAEDPRYEIYAKAAEALGLTAGKRWPHFPDAVHIQASKENSPTALGYTWEQINALMEQKFSVPVS